MHILISVESLLEMDFDSAPRHDNINNRAPVLEDEEVDEHENESGNDTGNADVSLFKFFFGNLYFVGFNKEIVAHLARNF